MPREEHVVRNRDQPSTESRSYFNRQDTHLGNELDIRDLFSFQLQRLAGLSTRIAALSMRPKYEVTPQEWRVLAVLKYLNQASLQELAKHSGVLKSQMSRTVSILMERGHIAKTANPEDGRSVVLKLSVQGVKLYTSIIGDSFKRNEEMLSTLSRAEQEILVELLGRVTRASNKYYHELRGAALELDSSQLDETED